MAKNQLDPRIVLETIQRMLAPGETLENFSDLIRKILLSPIVSGCGSLKDARDLAKNNFENAQKDFEPEPGITVELVLETLNSKELIEKYPGQAADELLALFASEENSSDEQKAKIQNNLGCAYIRQPTPETAKAIDAFDKALSYRISTALRDKIFSNKQSVIGIETKRKEFIEAEAKLNLCLEQQ